MILNVIMDNSTLTEDLASEHGLSLFIETEEGTVLFDTGASDAFSDNARAMGLDLSSVDRAVLSHGHYDHSGGLATFLKLNQKAPVYAQKSAFDMYYKQEDNGWEYIGVPESVKSDPRIILKAGSYTLAEGIEVLAGIRPRRLNPPDNRFMYQEKEGDREPDDFSHEQHLIIREKGKSVLITGCAHQGIVNILEEYYLLNGSYPDVVLGGFHLLDDDSDKTLESFVREIAAFLKNTGSQYFTGHCTGTESFRILQEIMGDKVQTIGSGMVLQIP